ncbi:MAG: malto-oligosyltrehalose trehalohydrolase [Pseudonocardiales bacterium]|nr:MAG: malto-oligosyltrehalose trehalohydrolase [Pseudonocardiales bacterium]
MATFEVWAPRAVRVQVKIGEASTDLSERDGGRWQGTAHTEHGTDYAYLIDDGEPLPDPRSRWQPDGVHGPSRLYDDTVFEWTDTSWSGRPLAGSVVYELHVGTFTEAGTFDAAAERLDHLVDLGVDLVELMPVNAWDGDAGWGYDGVDWYAVHAPYGGPDGLKRFVDACHTRGLGVLLDVVYNHLGPSGAYLNPFGPYFTERHLTPWGPAVNLDGPGSDQVRRHIVGNALMWLRDYHIDGLRLDAVHALTDSRATHLLEELSTEVEALAAHVGRPLSLIAESDLNDPRLVTAREAGGYGLTAQWSDDFHHALHALLTGERQGYYADFGALSALAKTLTGVYFHDGTWSSFRRRKHGRPVNASTLPGYRFLAYLQNHDQIGNRAGGDRLSAALSPGLLKIGATLVLTSPYTPMLFMGEEWAASTPWQFFTSHTEPALAEAVVEGRQAEFAEHGWATHEVPNPQHRRTFHASRLAWSEVGEGEHADMLDFYRKVIALRRQRPELTDPALSTVAVDFSEEARWLVVHRGGLRVVCSLAEHRQTVPLDGAPRGVLLSSTPGFVYSDGKVELDGESVAVVELA